MTTTIHIGDCRDILKTLPEKSVHCVVTSPPYYGLRDYGTARWEGGDEKCSHVVGNQVQDNKAPNAISAGVRPGCDASACKLCGAKRVDKQIGLEQSPEEYVQNLVEVFREVKRVLRDDGTLWLNLGDSYFGGKSIGKQQKDTHGVELNRQSHNALKICKHCGKEFRGLPTQNFCSDACGGVDNTPCQIKYGFKHKDLIGIPWRVAFALQADGWYLRQDIIWAKNNPMPESVKDRCTKSHEFIFLLVKSPKYYFDNEAIREDGKTYFRKAGGYSEKGSGIGEGTGGIDGRRGLGFKNRDIVTSGRNKRDVWQVNTKPYKGAHFATFPPALIEPCIKAGTSEKGVCSECGSPYKRITEATRSNPISRLDRQIATGGAISGGVGKNFPETTIKTIDWKPSCSCNAPITQATVLDPFAGSGTVGEVCKYLNRNSILIDLNPDYKQLMEKRIGV